MGSTGKAPRNGKDTKKSRDKYKKFDTLSVGTHRYPDRGADDESGTSKWWEDNSNVQELWNEASNSSEDSRAFERWTEGHFMMGQQYGGFGNMSSRDQAMTRIYDSYLDRSVIRENVEVSRRATAELLFGRGNTWVNEDKLNAMLGKEVVSLGNMSTGAASDGLTIGSGSSKPIEYIIRIPAGSVGAGMYIGNRQVNPYWRGEQREFMTNRDIGLRVVSYRRIPESERQEIRRRTGDSAARYQVVVEYTGLYDHNYS